MKPGATTIPCASIVRVAGPLTRPTPAIRPSRTATAPFIDGPPVPSTMRALTIRRSKGRGCACSETSTPPARSPTRAFFTAAIIDLEGTEGTEEETEGTEEDAEGTEDTGSTRRRGDTEDALYKNDDSFYRNRRPAVSRTQEPFFVYRTAEPFLVQKILRVSAPLR